MGGNLQTRLGLSGVLSLALVACSLAPFDPIVGDGSLDASRRADGAEVDAAGRDGAPADAPPGSEDCGNGIDDDGDGDADCADSDCVDVACVPAPAGWSAPGVLATAAGTPTCAIGSAVQIGGRRLDSVADVTCGACTCGDPTDVGCRASFRGWSNGSCALGPRIDSASFPGACERTLRTHAGISLFTLSVTATCSVSGPATPPVTTRPPAEFGESTVLCSTASAAGCSAGMACAPIGDGSGHCVSTPGDIDCPAGYPVRRRIHARVDDGRGCSSCSCNAAGTSCSGTLDTWSSPDCSAGPTGTDWLLSVSGPSAGCTNLGGAASSFRLTSATPVGARCDPSGGDPTAGCVAPTDPVTVCCQPGVAPGCPSGPGPAMQMIEPGDGMRGYCIDSTEVTNAQYLAFLAAGGTPSMHPGCVFDDSTTPSRNWPPDDSMLDFPVGYVDWCDAHAYCAWAGKRLCRLLDGTTGDGSEAIEADPARSEWTHVCDRTPLSDCSEIPLPVRSRMCCQTDGIYDLPGGAREWVDNCEDDREGAHCLTHRQEQCDEIGSRNRDDTNRQLGFRCCAGAIGL